MKEDRSLADRFLDAYARAETALNRKWGGEEYISFVSLVTHASTRDRFVRAHAQELKEYAQLRNAIVHQRDGKDEIIATPTQQVTQDFERICQQLEADRYILSYASKPVQLATPAQTIQEAFALMTQAKSMKLPAYTNDGFAGLITMQDLCEALLQGHPHTTHLQELLQEEMKDRVTFLAKDARIEQAHNVFAKAGVILITEHGKPHQKPIGIVTSNDYQRLLASFL